MPLRSPLLLITIAIGCAFIIPALFMDGMFMDGVLYASVSKNYALGFGTFWEPYFSATSYNPFHEQPPLLFFLQGVFFKLFGTEFYTERLYSLCTAAIGIFLVHKIWHLVYPNRAITFLPIIIYLTIPVTFWAYINGIAECTMVVFVLAAAYAQLKALRSSSLNVGWLLLSGAFLTLAGLTKGVQGLFLLGGPSLFWLIHRSFPFSRAAMSTALVLCFPALTVAFCFLYEPAYHSFEAYFGSRFTKTFQGVGATTGSHFLHLKELGLYIIPALIITGIAMLVCGFQAISVHFRHHLKMAIFMLLVGLSGILPLMVTLEQRGFYQLTALPFIALFFALIIAPLAEKIQHKINASKLLRATISGLALILLAGTLSITAWKWGQPKRDADKLHDLAIVSATIEEERLLILDKKAISDWPLICYLQRFYGISVRHGEEAQGRYLVAQSEIHDPEWNPLPLPLQTYRLYIRR